MTTPNLEAEQIAVGLVLSLRRGDQRGAYTLWRTAAADPLLLHCVVGALAGLVTATAPEHTLRATAYELAGTP